MHSIVKDISILSILSILPNKKFSYPSKTEKIKRIKNVIGVESSYKCNENLTTTDLFNQAANKILKKNNIDKNKIKTLICVTQTPDYLMPSCSNIIHQNLKLSEDCAVFDINLGCSGYVYGLWVNMNILSNLKTGYGLLLVGDTISKVVKKNDISNQLLFGDGVSATLLGKSNGADTHFNIGSALKGQKDLMILGSGFKNKKFNPTFYMNGKEVFSFALSSVPKLISSLLNSAKENIKNINFFIFHQANKMMLNKIFDSLNVENQKRLISIEKYGNTSSASIPITICNFKEKKFDKCLVAGFGAGFSFAAAILNLSKTKIFKILYYEKKN